MKNKKEKRKSLLDIFFFQFLCWRVLGITMDYWVTYYNNVSLTRNVLAHQSSEMKSQMLNLRFQIIPLHSLEKGHIMNLLTSCKGYARYPTTWLTYFLLKIGKVLFVRLPNFLNFSWLLQKIFFPCPSTSFLSLLNLWILLFPVSCRNQHAYTCCSK